MRLIFSFLLALFFFQIGNAQLGVTAGYRNFQAEDWFMAIAEIHGNEYSNLPGQSIGLDYWFRLKNKRIEFLPQLSYSRFEETFQWGGLKHRLVALHFNTNIYLFDLEGDCDCPTWSKEGGFFKKGFFIQLSPGIALFKNDFDDIRVLIIDGDGTALELGVGAGIDFGITDFLTVTPIVKFIYAPNANWVTNRGSGIDNLDGSYSQLLAGIRLGFRWNN